MKRKRTRFLRRSATILAFIATFTSSLLGQDDFTGKVIKQIEFVGLKRESPDELLLNLGTKVRIGDPFDRDAVSSATEALWLRRSFSEVRNPEVINFGDGVKIIFTVKEKLVVASLRFIAEDIGSKKPSISAKTLGEDISTTVNGRLSPYALQMDARQIEQTYYEDGYLFTAVRHVLSEKEDGAHIQFFINEGPRSRIHEVVFRGNKTATASVLGDLMTTRKKDWFFGLFHSGFYIREELARDADKIRQYYQSLGFFDVLVANDGVEFYDGNKRIRVRLVIEEGPRYSFTGYTIIGNTTFPTPTLLRLVQARPGGYFSAQRMDADRSQILKYYRDRAYVDARVDVVYEPPLDGTTMGIRFQINEGNEFSIDRVIIRGNTKTRQDVIRRELRFAPGEKINWEKMERSRSDLARLKFFSTIDYELLPGSAANRKDIAVKVEEEPTGRLLLGFGVTSGFGIIGNFAITKRNFDFTDLPDSIYDLPDSYTGAGQTLNIVLQPGSQRSFYQLSFTEPYLFDTRNSLTVAGSAIEIIRRDYDEERFSFRPTIGHAFDFDRDLVLAIGGRAEQVNVGDIDRDAAPDVFAVEGYTSVVAAHTRLSYDKVLFEPLEGPYSGHAEWLSVEYAGKPIGGDVDFSKLEGQLELYYPIYVHVEQRLHHVISLFSKFGIIEGRNNTESVPIFERFFLGGPNTVRGFRFRGLGPHFRKDPLGGSAAWYGNVEYSFPLFQKFLRGVLWLDYGNLAVKPSIFKVDEMRYAAGVGVRMNFPFLGQPLPIGLYVGDALKKEVGDRERTFLFTIGAPF